MNPTAVPPAPHEPLTRQSETCHNGHAQRWANPAATARRRASDRFLDLGGDPRRHRPASPNRIFPARRQLDGLRLDRLGQLRYLRPGGLELPIPLRARTTRLARQSDNAASLTGRRIPITVDTSTRHLRAASAWLISPGDLQKDLPLRLRRRFVSRRRALSDSGINDSSRITQKPTAWVISTPISAATSDANQRQEAIPQETGDG